MPFCASLGSARRNTTMRSTLVLLAPALVLMLATRSASAQPLVDERAGTLRVCARGPAAALASAERRRGDAAVDAASVLGNPELVFEHERAVTQPAESQTLVGLEVTLGLGGAWFLLQDAAAARREAAFAQADATLFDEALAFRRAFVVAAASRARLAVAAAQQRSHEDVATSLARLETGGEGSGYDLARQNAEVRRHRARVGALEARLAAAVALVRGHLEDEQAGLAPADLDDLAGAHAIGAPAADARRGTAPRVRSLEAEARAAAIEGEAAERRWAPDVRLLVGYRALTGGAYGDDMGHGIALRVALPITFFDHGQGETAEAEARREGALAAASYLRRAATTEAEAARAELSRLQPSAADLGAAADGATSLEADARRLYAADELSIAELIDAFRTGEEVRLERIDVAEARALARLALMRAEGTQFDAALDRACGGVSP
ncbi:MAG: TolC family protein [Myxococcales bacterium]|nr:TolC family protein [Myxococcales bacterium]